MNTIRRFHWSSRPLWLSLSVVALAWSAPGCKSREREVSPSATQPTTGESETPAPSAKVVPQEAPSAAAPATPPPATNDTAAAANQPVRTDVETVKDNPAAFIDRVVTVNGTIKEVYPNGVVRIDGEDSFWDDDILVLRSKELRKATVPPEGTKVRVTGQIKRFTVAEMEKDLDIDFDTKLETEFRDRLVLVASTMDLADTK